MTDLKLVGYQQQQLWLFSFLQYYKGFILEVVFISVAVISDACSMFRMFTISWCTFPQVNQGSDAAKKICVIDEIGKMELFSQAFIQAVRQMLAGSGTVVLGTIPIPKGRPLDLVEEIRSRKDVEVFTVSNIEYP